MPKPLHSLPGAIFSLCLPASLSQAQTEALQLANPAAIYCVETGGSYKIVTEDAGERGVCVLPDGREVDAWEHFRAQRGVAPATDGTGD